MAELKKQDRAPEVLCEIKKSRDVVMVVRLMEEEGLRYIDVRDWLVVKQAWGRGYWFDADKATLSEVAGSLLDAAERLDD